VVGRRVGLRRRRAGRDGLSSQLPVKIFIPNLESGDNV
jgi:hypothetical protein